MRDHVPMKRRTFLQGTAAGALLLVGCGSENEPAGRATAAGAPQIEFTPPATKLSGDLKILMWSHFVPQHDRWFDPFARDWGRKVGVNVTVDHIDNTQIPARIAAELAAGSGHDLIQYIGPLPQFEPSVAALNDLMQEAEKRFGRQVEVCRRCSYNPTTRKFFAYSPGWAPDPGNYRRSLWEKADLPDGPRSYDELLKGGSAIKRQQGVQLGIGMSPEIDSNMAARALIWSYGGAEQDDRANVTLDSPQSVAAVDYMKRLYDGAMTQEVFAWNPASNNQGLIAGKLSYILNSISAYRTMQTVNPTMADDVHFVKALRGPQQALAAEHVLYNYIVPKFAQNVDAAKEFLLHYTQNWARATWESKLYDFPAFRDRVPKLNEWLDDDPFGSNPPNKLSVLKDAHTWSVNVGYRGYASPAIGEVFGTFILPNMLARAARGQQSPRDAVATASAQMKPIFDKWRQKGLIGPA